LASLEKVFSARMTSATAQSTELKLVAHSSLYSSNEGPNLGFSLGNKCEYSGPFNVTRLIIVRLTASHSYWCSFDLFVGLNDSLVAANCPKLSLWDSKAVMAALHSSDHWVRGSSLPAMVVDGGAVPTLDGCDIIKVLYL